VKTLLLSLEISNLWIIVAGQIHSGLIGMTLFVFAQLFVSDYFETIFLHVILQLAVETVFPISVGIVSGSGSRFLAGKGPLADGSRRVGGFLSIHILGELLLLEGSYLLVPFLWVDSSYSLLDLGPGFPLSVRSNLIHIVQCEFVGLPLCHILSQLDRQRRSEQLHLQKLGCIVRASSFLLVAVAGRSGWFVLIAGIPFLQDHHLISDSVI
jgi:hypothetical protein